MEPEAVLQQLGLTPAEAKVYLLLLQENELRASVVAEKTGANRTFTYDRIRKLVNSGLVSSVIKDNRQYFRAAPPAQLLALLKEQEANVQAVLPLLQRMRLKKEDEPEVEVYSGKKGMRTVLNTLLKANGEVYAHGSCRRFEETMGSYYALWNNQRREKKMKLYVLTSEFVSLEGAEVGTLPEESETKTTTFTFEDRVIVAFWSKNPLAVLIKNKDIAKEQRALCKHLLSREVKIYSGVDGIVRAFYELIEEPGSEYDGFGYSWALAQVYGVKISDQWHRLRVRNRVKTRLIAYDDKNSVGYFRKRRGQWQQFAVRFLEKDLCGPACVSFNQRMIAIFIYTEPSVKVMVSRNPEMIAAYRRHFGRLWEMAKP